MTAQASGVSPFASPRVKALTIVVTLWVAAVVAITVAVYANRGYTDAVPAFNECTKSHDFDYCSSTVQPGRTFEWGSWLAWTGLATLGAVVVLVIVLVLLRPTSRQHS